MSLRIEVISRTPPAGTAKPVPLLFVHGAYGGAWIWEQHFLPFFAEHGYAAHALSLRGHGESDGFETLAIARLRDYVADLAQVAASLPAPPVLIGHSMGGMVVQKYLHEQQPVPAAVLMASVPPHGLLGSMFGMAFSNPALFSEMSAMQSAGPAGVNGIIVRRALFSDDAPDERVEEFIRRFQAESQVVLLDLMGLDLPPSTPCLDVPVLVLGAENDAFVFRGALEATATTYRTKAEVFPGMAHAMMLDHGWERVAERILTWVDATVGAPQPQTPKAKARGKRPPD